MTTQFIGGMTGIVCFVILFPVAIFVLISIRIDDRLEKISLLLLEIRNLLKESK